MPNPIAAIYLDNGKIIRIELLPQAAPNTVNSFLYAARHKIFDDHAIERIVPEDWIDVSYTGFGKPEGQYQIPNEFRLHPEAEPLDSDFGCVCMGGDGDRCLSGCEFFFPLRPCPCLLYTSQSYIRSRSSARSWPTGSPPGKQSGKNLPRWRSKPPHRRRCCLLYTSRCV